MQIYHVSHMYVCEAEHSIPVLKPNVVDPSDSLQFPNGIHLFAMFSLPEFTINTFLFNHYSLTWGWKQLQHPKSDFYFH